MMKKKSVKTNNKDSQFYFFLSALNRQKSTVPLHPLFAHNSKTIYLTNRYFASYAIFQELDTFKFTNCLTLEIHK